MWITAFDMFHLPIHNIKLNNLIGCDYRPNGFEERFENLSPSPEKLTKS